MQIVSCCAGWCAGSVFGVACQPNTCALFWLPDLQLPVRHLTTLVLFLSALPPSQPSPLGSRLCESTNSSGAVGSGSWAEAEVSTLPPRPGPECSWNSWSVILHVLPGVWHCWGPWRAPASCPSGGPYTLPQPPFFILCKARLQWQALKADCCRLCSCATPCRCKDQRTGNCWAKPGREIPLTPQANSWTENQNRLWSFILSPTVIDKHLLCASCRGWVFFSFQEPVVQWGANVKTKSWAWETSIRPDRPLIGCLGSGKTSHRRRCFIQIWRITEFNKEK